MTLFYKNREALISIYGSYSPCLAHPGLAFFLSECYFNEHCLRKCVAAQAYPWSAFNPKVTTHGRGLVELSPDEPSRRLRCQFGNLRIRGPCSNVIVWGRENAAAPEIILYTRPSRNIYEASHRPRRIDQYIFVYWKIAFGGCGSE